MRHLFIKHGLTVMRLALIVACGFVVFTIIHLQQQNKDILVHVQQQQDAGDRQRKELAQAVTDLKNDNAQQTVILCTLILGQNVQVTGDDAAKIEAICKQKIKQNNDIISSLNAAQKPVIDTPQADSSGEALPGTTSNPTPPQTAPTQPTQNQGLLHLVPDSVPLIGKLL